MTSFTYTPTSPADAYGPTVAYGISFEPGESVSLTSTESKAAIKASGLTPEAVEAKLDGNPEFTKAGEDRDAVSEAKQRAKDAAHAEKLRVEAADAAAAAAAAGPR